MRILVAEDEQNLNRLISEKLKKEHYSVDSCFNGRQALDYFAGAEYDAVVLDIMMPEMDGYEFTETLRSVQNNLPRSS